MILDFNFPEKIVIFGNFCPNQTKTRAYIFPTMCFLRFKDEQEQFDYYKKKHSEVSENLRVTRWKNSISLFHLKGQGLIISISYSVKNLPQSLRPLLFKALVIFTRQMNDKLSFAKSS